MHTIKSKYSCIPYLLIFPAIILIVVFKIYPIFTTLMESFTFKGDFSFETYQRVLADKSFWNSLQVTLKINVVMIPFQIALSLFLALLCNVQVKGITAFRTIYFLPFTISLSVATIIWSLMFSVNNGVLNSVLNFIGIDSQRFLVDKNQALWCIVIIASWKGCGYWMMFFLAGLKNIDTSIYESATVDGAGYFTTLFRITLPLIKRVMLFVLVANTTANVLLFVPMQMLTKGGPQGSTNVLMYEAYNSAFRYADRERSAVMIIALLFIIAIISLAQFRLLQAEDRKVK